MAWLTKTLSGVLLLSFRTTVDGLNDCLTPATCVSGSSDINLRLCSLTDDDFNDISNRFDAIGRSGMTELDLRENSLTAVPAGLFDNMASLECLSLSGNQLQTLPPNVFADLGSLGILRLSNNALTSLPADAFAGLSGLDVLFLDENELTTLPAGTFVDVGSGGLASVHLDGNDELQCVPTVTVTGEWTDDVSSFLYIEELPVTDGLCECTPSAGVTCGAGSICAAGALGHTCAACPAGATMCGDPHMQGLRGQTIDWSGVDGGWYYLVTDDAFNLQVNVRLTAPLPESFPDRQLITGLSIASEGHSLVIEVANPYTVDTDGCFRGIFPCLADGGLRAIVDGEEVGDLLRFSRNECVADGIALSASNLPVECRQFGGDKIWTRMYEEMLQGQRQLHTEESFESWILRFDHMAAADWCTQYIEQNDLADLQSNHAIFKIETSAVTVRLNVGTNYQGNGELDGDGRVLPDLEFWQMDVGLQGLSLESESMSGILGETARPVMDMDGNEVMKGYEAFRGTVEDYRVSGSLGTDFAFETKH